MKRTNTDNAAQSASDAMLERKRALARARTKKRRRTIVITLLLLLLAAGGTGGFLWWQANSTPTSAFRNPNADIGQLEGKSPDEIQSELNRVVDEGMFNISIAEVLTFPDGTSEGDVRIENVPSNVYLMDVSITLDDTGEVVYESGVLEPNHHISRDYLQVDLEKGTYAATATFRALLPETEAVVGQAAAQVTILVEG